MGGPTLTLVVPEDWAAIARRRVARHWPDLDLRIASAPADPREVFQAAILANASCLILAHNHPSGDPNPSAADITLTERLCAAGRMLQIGVMDHIVVGGGTHVSLRKNGLALGWDTVTGE